MPYKSRDKDLSSKRDIYARNRDFLSFLKDVPCHDCGGRFPSYVMDFDHVRGKKHRPLSQMVHYSVERIQEEVEKCDIVCSNCHRIRSHKNDVYGGPKFGHDKPDVNINYDWVSDVL